MSDKTSNKDPVPNDKKDYNELYYDSEARPDLATDEIATNTIQGESQPEFPEDPENEMMSNRYTAEIFFESYANSERGRWPRCCYSLISRCIAHLGLKTPLGKLGFFKLTYIIIGITLCALIFGIYYKNKFNDMDHLSAIHTVLENFETHPFSDIVLAPKSR